MHRGRDERVEQFPTHLFATAFCQSFNTTHFALPPCLFRIYGLRLNKKHWHNSLTSSNAFMRTMSLHRQMRVHSRSITHLRTHYNSIVSVIALCWRFVRVLLWLLWLPAWENFRRMNLFPFCLNGKRGVGRDRAHLSTFVGSGTVCAIAQGTWDLAELRKRYQSPFMFTKVLKWAGCVWRSKQTKRVFYTPFT